MKSQRDVNGVYLHILKDAYSAETQITEALPKVIEACENPQLKQSLTDHLAQTKTHVQKVAAIVKDLGEEPTGVTCEGMKGLLKEGGETIEEFKQGALRDAALIVACQKVEHYEIAAYGSLKVLASDLGRPQDIGVYDSILAQEEAADTKLTSLAEGGVNAKAMRQPVAAGR